MEESMAGHVVEMEFIKVREENYKKGMVGQGGSWKQRERFFSLFLVLFKTYPTLWEGKNQVIPNQ
jgi:hypothetical protein